MTRAARIAALARAALESELALTPKPGLVDRAGRGAHADMDYGLMMRSIAAIAPWFGVFFRRGEESCEVHAREALPRLRCDGLACERDMFAATGGVNTHKGGVFALGLLCAAAGRLHGRGVPSKTAALCGEVRAMTAGMVTRELLATDTPRTAGERFFRHHGLSGARGEAEAGFPTARRYGLAAYRAARVRGSGEARAMTEALLALMSANADTNLFARGGREGLRLVQDRATALLRRPWASDAERCAQVEALGRELVRHNLSPGGSADLLAVSWFLANVEETPRESKHRLELVPARPAAAGAVAAGGGGALRLRAGAGPLQ